MGKIFTIILVAGLVCGFSPRAEAQTLNDADHIIIRLRAVCNQGQGGTVKVSFEVRSRASGANYIGGFADVLTYNSSKLVIQGTQPRYNTSGAWYPAPYFRDHNFGSSAWYNQNGPPGGSMPLNSTYFQPASDCNGNPLNDGYFEIMRYTFQVGVSANGTVDFLLYDILPYKSGQAFQADNMNTAIFYSGAQNNGNDSTKVIQNLVIPIELAAFSAAGREDGSVFLSWKTTTETSNLGFEVQRRNGEEFEPIGFVPGAGTTTAEQAYSYVDKDPLLENGFAYYRLKQIDVDGTTSFSPTVAALMKPETIGLSNSYPNPVNVGASTVIPYTLTVPATVDMTVYNMLGETVSTLVSNEALEAGRYLATWSGMNNQGGTAAAGTYLVRFNARLSGGDVVSETQRVTILR